MENIKMENKTMKNIFKLTALACLMAAASNAVAAPTANVQIKGTVKMGACTPTLSNNGIADYGNVITDQLSATEDTQMPHKYITMNITCGSPTLLTWQMIENRFNTNSYSVVILDSAITPYDATNNNNVFGVGLTAQSKRIGGYALAFDYTQMTTAAGLRLIQKTSSEDWILSGTALATRSNPEIRFFSLAGPDALEPTAFSDLTIPMKISFAIDNGLNITDVTSIDGNATLNLNYL
ncbi:DUF1120 domain-containing protein [Enterobacteriaceae bacterium Kacie_13]|nr:DUF1120 domain-containing protein [Enterobacteriaceae bacterium Kacie_13]